MVSPMATPIPTRAATVLLLAATVILTIAVPARAGGGPTVVYKGPVEQAPVKGFPAKPAIELFVHPPRPGHRKASTTVTAINVYDIALRCENGQIVGAGEGRGNLSLVEFLPRYPLPVTGGKFRQPPAEAATEGTILTVAGTVSRSGASGTLSIKEDIGDVPGSEEGQATEHFGTCRSGTLNWTAPRGG